MLFKRFSSFEGLELRALLSGGSLLSDSALYASAGDLHATSLDSLSVSCLVASNLAGRSSSTPSTSEAVPAAEDVPAAVPLAATSNEEQAPADDPPIIPLIEGTLVNVFMRAEDLEGNEITSTTVGEDFKLLVFVDDVRTSTTIKGTEGQDLFGVFAAYVRATFDTDLVSVVPGTLSLDDFFNDIQVHTDTSTPGEIRAGGATIQFVFGDPPEIGSPGSDPQLLWSVTLHAGAGGTTSFGSFFELFTDEAFPPDWLLYGENDFILDDNITVSTLDLSIIGPEISIDNVTKQETDDDQPFVFTVSLSEVSTQQITVAYTTTDGTASGTNPGQDYVPQSATLTFESGQLSRTITITVLGDNDQEDDETFTVMLSDPEGAGITDGTGLGTIENDDQTQIGITSVSQLEGDEDNMMVFTVTISGATTSPVIVPFATQDGSAEAPSDYETITGAVTFAAGSTAPKFITVVINGDTDPEANEDFEIVLVEPANAEFDASGGMATGTLINDDGPHISFVANQVSQLENVTQFVFTVTIGEAGDEPVTVVFTTTGGTATAGSDYTFNSGTLTFIGATIAQDITVTVNNDDLNEADETFSLVLSDPQNATLVETTATGTIENDDPLPTLEVEPVAETEGVPIVFTVSLSAPSGQTVVVRYDTVDGSALAGSDYEGVTVPAFLTFMPGETQKFVTVLVNTDALNEADETFQLRLFDATNVADSEDLFATGTIENDDLEPTLSITGPQNTNEGTSASPTQFVFTATLSEASGQTITVMWSTDDGTAVAPGDYTAASGTLTFMPGETTQTILVSVVADAVLEASETFTINLADPQHVTLEQTSITGNITNDDALPTLSITGPLPQNEGDTGGTPFVFTVTLSAESEDVVTVSFETQNGTATAADFDFDDISGAVTFQPGVTTRTITVAVRGDTRHEAANEDFVVNIFLPDGATIATGTGTGVIVDDEGEPAVSIADVTHAEGDTGTTAFVFTLTLSRQSVNQVTVAFATQDGTATIANNDYNSTSGTVTFAPGTTERLVTVFVLGDKFSEGNETFSVVLSNPVGATTGDGTGTGTITNESTDDVANLPSSITGKVFVDSNSDGAQTGRERALAGVQVFLSGAAEMLTTTGADGSYSFNNLNPGTYELQFAQPAQYVDGRLHIGSQGGEMSATGDSFTFTILAPGSVVGGENNFTTSRLLSQFISQRLFLASALGAASNPPAQTVSVAVSTVTNPITASNATSTSISGSGTAGVTISVVATSGSSSTGALMTTVANNGSWSIAGINVSALADGTITYTVTATGTGGSTASASITATKDTVAPAVTIGSVTNPVHANNADDASISGTGEAGAMISVVVTGGANSASAQTTVADNGTWSASGIDVSSLADGMITYTVTATDAVGNTGSTSMAVLKDTQSPTVAIGMVIPDPINAANEDDVTINGTGEAGASISVTVSDGSDTTGPFTTTVAANGTWTIDGINTSGLDDGTLTFTVTATDSASNTATMSITAVKDTVTDVIVSDVTDPITAANETMVMISGTGELGAMISVVATDGESSTGAAVTTVDDQGNWSLTIDTSSLDDGTITFTVTATDEAENTDVATTTAEKDTVTEVAISEVTDPIGIGDDDTSISGTGEVGALISVVATDGVNATEAKTATVLANGTWSIEGIDVSDLNDGTLTYTVTATDTVGNTNLTSITAEKATLAIAMVTDPINAEDADMVELSGTGEVGATVSVVATDGGNSTDAVETTIDGEGNWSVTIDVSDLNDGTLTFTVTATDAEDNSIEKSITAEKDTATEVFDLGVTDPITAANETMVMISGIGEVGAMISVVATDGVNSTEAVMTTVDGEGNWSATIDASGLDDGTITFGVTATDLFGNTQQKPTTAEKDTVAEVAISEVTDPIGIGDDDDTSISGTGEIGATIEVVVSDGVNATEPFMTTVDGDGNWLIEGIDVSDLDDGTLTYTVTATDLVGNTNETSITAEKATLVIAMVTDPINAEDSHMAVISGTGEVGAMIFVVGTDGENTTGEVLTTVDDEGNWSVTIDVSDLNDGTITFTVTATDAEDNSIEKSITAEKDTATEVFDLGVTDPITAANETMVMISGIGEVGAMISVVATDGVNSTEAVMTTVDGEGNWSATIDASGLNDGTITFTVTATDLAGNTDEETTTAEKDTVAEVAISEVTDPIDIGDADDTSISGTGEIDATIEVVVSDGVHSTGIFSFTITDGTWSIEGIDVTGLNDGTITYTVTATDLLGNTNETSITAQKHTLAIAMVTDPITEDNETSVELSGTGEVGAMVSVVASDGGNSTDAVETTIDGEGNWSVTIDVSALDEGTITFTATATDDEDNTIEKSITAHKDTVTEVAITDVTDPITAENADNTSISGTGENGAIISVVASDGIDSTIAFMVTVADGIWSIEGIDVSALADGTITYTVTATDTVGNTTEVSVMVEKIAPAPLAMMDGDDEDDDLAVLVMALSASSDDPDAIDEALAVEDDWMPDLA
ncbi:MAG: Calx-beta domain-containing protein [Pirellulales bacterium]